MRDAASISLSVRALGRGAFAPFGDVIETAGRAFTSANEGTAQRFDDLADIDVSAQGGQPRVSIFRAEPRRLPLELRMLERHPLSSQMFVPLERQRFLIVVAAAGDPPTPATINAFLSDGRQGVNLRRGVWHHPLIALERASDFLVLERRGPGRNCDEHWFDTAAPTLKILATSRADAHP